MLALVLALAAVTSVAPVAPSAPSAPSKASSATGAATPPATVAPVAAKTPDRICHTTQEMGTMFTRRVCHSPEEWRELSAQGADWLDDVTRHSGAGSTSFPGH